MYTYIQGMVEYYGNIIIKRGIDRTFKNIGGSKDVLVNPAVNGLRSNPGFFTVINVEVHKI